MAAALTFPVPGVYFAPSAPAPEQLPRLDTPAFVGFAERGPLDQPVEVHGVDEYRAVFGGRLEVAHSPSGGTVTAYLPDAVAAFFANGGRRAYVVRVAGAGARTTQLKLPGVIHLIRQEGRDVVGPATLNASSPGGWSTGVRAATRLRATALDAQSFTIDNAHRLERHAQQPVTPGDVLRITLHGGTICLATVAPEVAHTTLVPLSSVWAVRGASDVALIGEIVSASILSAADGAGLPLDAWAHLTTRADHLSLMVAGDVGRLRDGDIFELRGRNDVTWLMHATELTDQRSSSDGDLSTAIALAPEALERVDRLPRAPIASVERLQFDLLVEEPGRERRIESNLAFGPGHPRFWPRVIAPGGERALVAPDDAERATWVVPIAMAGIVTDRVFRRADIQDGGIDDLATIDARMFVDGDLAVATSLRSPSLMNEATHRKYVLGVGLTGIHSLLFVDDVALISVPDAVHDGWRPADPQPPDVMWSPPLAEPPDRSCFDDCLRPPSAPPVVAEPVVAPRARLSQAMPFGEDAYDRLLDIQEAIVGLCQARRDVVGVLALPRHFDPTDCREWRRRLRARLGLPEERTFSDEMSVMADSSFIATYHPWVLIADAANPAGLRPVPPDGVACGAIAQRERDRQVWVAPANQPFRGVLGVDRELSRADRAALHAIQVNPVGLDALEYRALSAHTMSDDRTLLQLSVRRLMILLRKVAVRRGNELVFAPNDENLHEALARALEDMLEGMFMQGAFAGRTARDAYRVRLDPSLNTPQSIDAGRLIAEIQVAPSQPAEFISVVLTRSGDGMLEASERN